MVWSRSGCRSKDRELRVCECRLDSGQRAGVDEDDGAAVDEGGRGAVVLVVVDPEG